MSQPTFGDLKIARNQIEPLESERTELNLESDNALLMNSSNSYADRARCARIDARKAEILLRLPTRQTELCNRRTIRDNLERQIDAQENQAKPVSPNNAEDADKIAWIGRRSTRAATARDRLSSGRKRSYKSDDSSTLEDASTSAERMSNGNNDNAMDSGEDLTNERVTKNEAVEHPLEFDRGVPVVLRAREGEDRLFSVHKDLKTDIMLLLRSLHDPRPDRWLLKGVKHCRRCGSSGTLCSLWG